MKRVVFEIDKNKINEAKIKILKARIIYQNEKARLNEEVSLYLIQKYQEAIEDNK